MAAEVLATAGVAVTIHEHMASVGRKLLLAGRGGLNLTHSEPVGALVDRYGPATARLAPAIERFGPTDLRAWAAGLGEPTFVGSSGRVFPASFRATPLLRAWLARLVALDATIVTRSRWLGWTDGGTMMFVSADGERIERSAEVVVLALGGASWPRVGSDGSWVEPVRRAGIDVRDLRASNAGLRIAWTAGFAARFAGTPLKNMAIRAGGVGGTWVRGDAMVTEDGLEGGPVYAQSAAIRQQLDGPEPCIVHVDLHPDRSAAALTERLERRRPTDSVATTLRRAVGLSPVATGVLREATGNSLPHDSASLAELIKHAPLQVDGLMPLRRAISSAGGIALSEVDDSFMLRRFPGVFVAGEMLDWDAPTGGYLLQASISTGVAAARGAVDWLVSRRSSRPSTSSRA
jgi:uncharacterized flavoprotein (TIGR03862 family)